ncbi:hypothetical protein L5D93_28780 [Paenibacillus thiaminolyticus]|nr:hypothetical protein [Paenibacillus thiaminolyticus]
MKFLSSSSSRRRLQSLEFLAWFVRDCARGGKKIQLRPFALPPETPYARQLGTTLNYISIYLWMESRTC